MTNKTLAEVWPDVFDGAAYARDLMALRAHAKMIASYLRQAGVPEHNIRSVLVSITEAGMADARAETQ